MYSCLGELESRVDGHDAAGKGLEARPAEARALQLAHEGLRGRELSDALDQVTVRVRVARDRPSDAGDDLEGVKVVDLQSHHEMK